MLVIIVWLAYVYFVSQVLFNGLRIVNFPVSLGICIVGFFVMAVWGVYHVTRPRRRPAASETQAQPAAAPAAAPVNPLHSVSFKVAGVSYDNDDGTSRQEILRHLKFRDEPYASPDEDLMLDFIKTEFDGQLAIEVQINGYQVGFVPRAYIKQVEAAIDSFAWSVDDYAIYGGNIGDDGEKHNYGCNISISWAE